MQTLCSAVVQPRGFQHQRAFSKHDRGDMSGYLYRDISTAQEHGGQGGTPGRRTLGCWRGRHGSCSSPTTCGAPCGSSGAAPGSWPPPPGSSTSAPSARRTPPPPPARGVGGHASALHASCRAAPASEHASALQRRCSACSGWLPPNRPSMKDQTSVRRPCTHGVEDAGVDEGEQEGGQPARNGQHKVRVGAAAPAAQEAPVPQRLRVQNLPIDQGRQQSPLRCPHCWLL